ncbi:hypothetical protein BD414DRAFT_418734 [Trametes punicea]|nr:hypothetical protein BD414DRAFT_418734 [Trametes punicea]
MASSSTGQILKRADPTTIHNKFLVGYQGWFTCAGDGEPVGPGHHGWLHWFNYPIPDGGRPNVDLWPDVSEYSPSELFPAPGVKYADGTQAFLFSSRHPKTVQRHFHWMAQHGVDGAFLQRFLGQTDLEQGNEGIRNQRDEVGDRVMEAAEKEGRVFAIMYDVSGVAPDRIQRLVEHDWIHLTRRKAILDSPAYLREQGRPVIALWGFGMSDAHHTPAMVRAVTRYIRDNTPGGAYIMAGVPAHWRTSVMDADPDPEFVKVWLEDFDAISPWTIGRYSDEEGADRFEQEKIKGDVELIRQHNERWDKNRGTMRKIDYIPVIFPGGSGYNLSEGKWGWNDCPRKGGHFMWRQLFNVQRHGVRTIYGAMWDEYDEGTAFMPVVSHKRQLPVLEKYSFMALDEDGFDLPPDWYMRICGFAAEALRGERTIHETFPSKELQDYWSTRPRYEEGPSASTSRRSTSADKSQPFEKWEELNSADEPPPPPYSLEAEETQPGIAPANSNSPPPVPLERRPTLQHGAQSQAPPAPPLSTRPAPPSVNSSSRPQSIAASASSRSSATAALDVPLEAISNLSISSPSPSALPLADYSPHASHSHSPSPRPTSPAHSHHSHTSSQSASASLYPQPESSFTPSLFPSPSPIGGSSGPWSQAPWPPPEWGVPHGHSASAAPPQHRIHPPYEGETASQYYPGYAPSYPPGYQSAGPPPPLRPRPSVSQDTRPPTFPHAPDEPHRSDVGFAFPEAHVPSGDEFWAPSPAHSSYRPYQDSSGLPQAPPFPSSPGLYYEPAGPAPPPPPPPRKCPYGSPAISSSYYAPIAPETQGVPYGPPDVQGAPPWPPNYARPPTHPASGYSGNTGAPPTLTTGPLQQAFNLVGNVAGQGAKTQLQNLASSGSKLFNKYRK